MAIHNRTGVQRGQQRSVKSTMVPVPQGGMDAQSTYANMDISRSIYSYNLIATDGGLEVRSGYGEHCLGTDDTTPTPAGLGSSVKTIIPFEGISSQKLFAVTERGIYDITTKGGTPVKKTAAGFSTGTGSGFGVYAIFTNDAGAEFIFYADRVNGLWRYTASTDTWAQDTLLNSSTATLDDYTGASNVTFVTVHKNRIWLVDGDAGLAWYAGAGKSTDTAIVSFDFGSKFAVGGGEVAGLFNWSVDGGAGLDDYLVAFSRGGDVIPYQFGLDPSDALEISSKGRYYIGRIPVGGRFATEYAGELYILCSYGIISMSDLLRGVESEDPHNPNSLSFRIARLIRTNFTATLDTYRWSITFLPNQGVLVVVLPFVGGTEEIQYVVNVSLKAWSIWRDLNITSLGEWKSKTYFGTEEVDPNEPRVMVMDEGRDNVLLTPPGSGNNGTEVCFSILTSFQDLQSPSNFKQVQYIRPDYLAVGNVNFKVKALYDYNGAELMFPGGVQDVTGDDVWNTGLWDTAVWSSPVENLTPNNKPEGSGGIGRMVAIAMTGKASQATRFLSWDISWTEGHFM